MQLLMSPSPSFNSFSDSNLAGIAARVIEELSVEDGTQDGEFEFTWVVNSESHPAVTADEIFQNGKILPVYQSGSINGTDMNSGTKENIDLYGVPEDTYCLWRPRAVAEAAEGRWKRGSFPGSVSKKWNLKDFLQRNFSVGSRDNNSVVLLSPKEDGGGKNVKRPLSAAGRSTPPLYNRGSGEKRRSYLLYGLHQVGFFAHMNGLGKILHPF